MKCAARLEVLSRGCCSVAWASHRVELGKLTFAKLRCREGKVRNFGSPVLSVSSAKRHIDRRGCGGCSVTLRLSSLQRRALFCL